MCLFVENARRGGGFSQERGGGRGAWRVFVGNWGGGLDIFFGAEVPTKKMTQKNPSRIPPRKPNTKIHE